MATHTADRPLIIFSVNYKATAVPGYLASIPKKPLTCTKARALRTSSPPVCLENLSDARRQKRHFFHLTNAWRLTVVPVLRPGHRVSHKTSKTIQSTTKRLQDSFTPAMPTMFVSCTLQSMFLCSHCFVYWPNRPNAVSVNSQTLNYNELHNGGGP